MADYKETTLSGTAYTRSNHVSIANPLTGVKAINFMEEQVVNLGDEQIIRHQGGFQEPFTTENSNTEFDLIHPVDSTPLGIKMEYKDLYIAIHSLYFHLAKKRDAAIQAAKLAAATPAEPNAAGSV